MSYLCGLHGGGQRAPLALTCPWIPSPMMLPGSFTGNCRTCPARSPNAFHTGTAFPVSRHTYVGAGQFMERNGEPFWIQPIDVLVPALEHPALPATFH